ncbi:MAG: hypothetical protein CVV02_06470 [Firmicutes bacterium HGW-Firmicutes-7]|nr:MAG: hypothetical protein CVV02_06470 [Firmicutes bacterium HGW-Firmicutes-7]
MKKIIFVCTGNTCRSPMAEKLGEKIAEEKGLKVDVLSRGISVIKPEPAHSNAIKALALYELNLTDHIAKNFNDIDANEDALVLTMTMKHKEYLLQLFPSLVGSVFGIKEYIGEVGDIVDPYGMQVDVYCDCAKQLRSIIIKIIDKLKETSNDSNWL